MQKTWLRLLLQCSTAVLPGLPSPHPASLKRMRPTCARGQAVSSCLGAVGDASGPSSATLWRMAVGKGEGRRQLPHPGPALRVRCTAVHCSSWENAGQALKCNRAHLHIAPQSPTSAAIGACTKSCSARTVHRTTACRCFLPFLLSSRRAHCTSGPPACIHRKHSHIYMQQGSMCQVGPLGCRNRMPPDGRRQGARRRAGYDIHPSVAQHIPAAGVPHRGGSCRAGDRSAGDCLPLLLVQAAPLQRGAQQATNGSGRRES